MLLLMIDIVTVSFAQSALNKSHKRIKRRLLILGKADLADGAATSRWLSYFAAHNQEAMAYDASRGKAKEALKRIREFLQENSIYHGI